MGTKMGPSSASLLLKAFRSPLMKALDRSVETFGLLIITSSVTLIKSANQSGIKLCLKQKCLYLFFYFFTQTQQTLFAC